MGYSIEELNEIKLKKKEYKFHYDKLDKFIFFCDKLNEIDTSIIEENNNIKPHYKNKYNNNPNYYKHNGYNNNGNNSYNNSYNNSNNNKFINGSHKFNKLNRNKSGQNFNDKKIIQEKGGSALRSRLNKGNKEHMILNGEINKLTETNISTIYDKIVSSIYSNVKTNLEDQVIEKEEFSESKLVFVISNLIKKCIGQPTFTALYIKLFQKLFKKVSSREFIKTQVKKITANIKQFVSFIEVHDSMLDEKKMIADKKENIFSSLINNNKQYEGLGTIYSLFYVNNFITIDSFKRFINDTVKMVAEYIEWEPCTNEVLEKYINVLIGLMEFGYYKMIKNIDYDAKITFELKIEQVLSNKKIEMRIKYNLQNLYDDLKAGKRK